MACPARQPAGCLLASQLLALVAWVISCFLRRCLAWAAASCVRPSPRPLPGSCPSVRNGADYSYQSMELYKWVHPQPCSFLPACPWGPGQPAHLLCISCRQRRGAGAVAPVQRDHHLLCSGGHRRRQHHRVLQGAPCSGSGSGVQGGAGWRAAPGRQARTRLPACAGPPTPQPQPSTLAWVLRR